MKNLYKIFEFIKIALLPRNLSNINSRKQDLKRIENELVSLNQKLNDLDFDSIINKIDTLTKSYSKLKDNNVKSHESNEFDILTLVAKINKKFENQFSQIESLLSIYNSLPNLKFLPATRGWAGSPDFLSKITETILKEKPSFILEAGSGVSTIVIGLALQLNKKGKSISLDHEMFYFENTKKNIQLNEIGDTSIVKHCPFRDYKYFDEEWKWYETENLNLNKKIDMLIIDGPPRITQFLARYPAIPLLHGYFADRILILLDDSNRDDEIITINKWVNFLESNKFKVSVTEFNNFEKGMAILDVYR